MADKTAFSRHDRRSEQTRKQLIQTTLSLILEIGYDSITIQDITDRADLGRGTFYIYFKDKAEVLWAAIHDMMCDMEQEAHKNMDIQAPHVEYLALLNIFRHAEKNRIIYRAALGGQGSAMLTGRIYDLIAKMLLDDIRRISVWSESGFHVPDEVLAQMLTGLLTRQISWWLDNPDTYSAEEMASMAYRVVYRREPPAPVQ